MVDNKLESIEKEKQRAKQGKKAQNPNLRAGAGKEGGGTSGKSIVCTAMYQTTGLEDWSKAMKIWYIYQKKYLTIQHQEGYHKLLKKLSIDIKIKLKSEVTKIQQNSEGVIIIYLYI